jgi:hypothetical protein
VKIRGKNRIIFIGVLLILAVIDIYVNIKILEGNESSIGGICTILISGTMAW